MSLARSCKTTKRYGFSSGEQEVDLYDMTQRIAECDQQLQKHLATFVNNTNPGQPPSPKGEIKKKKKPTQNAPNFDLSHELERISGVNLTRIDGIVMVAQTVLSKVGLDMSRWKTEAPFFSWLGLCPGNRISGDRVLRRGTRRVINRAATVLRMVATTLIQPELPGSPVPPIAHQARRPQSHYGDGPPALARFVYRMLKYCQQYVDKGAEHYEQRNREQQINLLKKKAAQFGLQVIATHP
jgi:transposase